MEGEGGGGGGGGHLPLTFLLLTSKTVCSITALLLI